MSKDLIGSEVINYPTLGDIKKLIKSGVDEFSAVIKDVEDGTIVDSQADPIVIIYTIVNSGYSLEKCEPTDDSNKEWYLRCKKKRDDNV